MLTLLEIAQQIEPLIDQIDLSAEAKTYGLDQEHTGYLTAWIRDGNEYYKALAALVKVLGAKKVLELGTYLGASAVAMSKFAEKVITLDINLQRLNNPRFYLLNGKVEASLLPDKGACLLLTFSDYDFIFIDLNHEGEIEEQLHHRLSRDFQGIVAYDAIAINSKMRQFWENIDRPKLSCNWHHSGFGLVDYRVHDQKGPT